MMIYNAIEIDNSSYYEDIKSSPVFYNTGGPKFKPLADNDYQYRL
ncbi:hypothetical protein [Caloranaerobacter azorensis]|nr:hypothetical protein [Caloranaerobacter azorensis]